MKYIVRRCKREKRGPSLLAMCEIFSESKLGERGLFKLSARSTAGDGDGLEIEYDYCRRGFAIWTSKKSRIWQFIVQTYLGYVFRAG